MEVDEEDDVDASPVGGSSGGGGGGNTKFPGGHLSDDRGGKRMHHDAHSATPSHVSDAQEEPEGEHSDA
ncbi:hypothetical protein SERLADRAFT_461473 [Serpula lacrymans var. lacrymans S7.9]|uniref:Uncharacterized protein n=1 Tax=Serpula lacrymans var. lacrymans (strain S7.9) TaxID=578457 RepID=F8NP84_SERL9|nr:uncharacterized protein SERLADRAFT_461473 [Serpula lacrymans var. lacrymans S7.9]EGO27649.1 hypothetical protein SERLADRAFT_461473 [Serpula lacrymans var. lacrymans S7.9]